MRGVEAHGDGAVVLAPHLADRDARRHAGRCSTGSRPPVRPSAASTNCRSSRRACRDADRDRAAVLAVDGGNSKTDVALVAADGRLLAAVRGPTTSHQQVGLEAGADRLAALVTSARQRAGLARTMRRRTSASTPWPAPTPRPTSRRLTRALTARGLAQHDLVVNDAFAPIRAGSIAGWGVALICGSGMNAAGHRARRPDRRGWPRSVGSRATGAAGATSGWRRWARRSGRATGADRGPRSRRACPRQFGFSRPIDLTRAIERRIRRPRPDWASCRRSSSGRPREGDAVARSIVDRLADEFVAMAGRDDPPPQPRPARPGRGDGRRRLQRPRRRLRGTHRAGVHAVAPNATLCRADAPPVLGAALLGLDRLGEPASTSRDAAEARLRAGLRDWGATSS